MSSPILSHMNYKDTITFSSDVSSYDRQNIPLKVKGQCAFLFTLPYDCKNAFINLYNSDKTDGINILFNEQCVFVNRIGTEIIYRDEKCNSGIKHINGIIYWISIDSQNQRIFAGHGEARIETQIYHYQFPYDVPNIWESNKRFLEGISTINLDDTLVTPKKLLTFPIDTHVPVRIIDSDRLTMDDIAEGKYLPSANLPEVSRQLYGCVSGKNFVLNDEKFPDFSKAIEYSIATPGCWCYDKLQEKKSEFDPEHPNIYATYLRITFGDNDGDSPGIPYVMEIWPVGHYSPVHNHADSEAIIRVLHGNIVVSLFPYLSPDDNVEPFATEIFVKDSVTWLSNNLNQCHQLSNPKTNNKTCITIQCYMYPKEDNKHYDYFDYKTISNHIEHYEPDSDMDFIEFKKRMKTEWNEYCNKNLLTTSCCIGY